VEAAKTLALDAKLLSQFPEGYRHLAYLQMRDRLPIKKDMPARGQRWLAGEPL
jgi:hypothetical protein